MNEPRSHSAIEVEHLYAAYDGHAVLRDVNLSLPAGQWTAIMGPNGAGKSTLFRIILGAMKPVRGQVRIFGLDPAQQRRSGNVAYMAQQEALEWDFPLSVQDTVLTGRFGHMRQDPLWRRLLPPRWADSRHWEVVHRSLDAVAMLPFAQRPIGALSGGQKKRVLLARALAQEADLLLLDEPLAGVDSASEKLIMRVLAAQRSAGRSIVMVTHDLESSRHYADRVVLINRHVVGMGPPEHMLVDEMLSRTAAAGWVGIEHRGTVAGGN